MLARLTPSKVHALDRAETGFHATIPLAARPLLQVLSQPHVAPALGLGDWDAVIRVGRAARLLGCLRAALEDLQLLSAVPVQARAHLDAAWTEAAYRSQMVRRELHCIERALRGYDGPIVLLKGAAYLVAGLPMARGRMPSDVDFMVPRERLDQVEALLKDAGYASQKLDPYDQRYYRQWTHELPPMRRPEHPIEIDVHHTILPPTGRARPDTRALFDATVQLPASRFRMLSPADRFVHAAAHVFQDSELDGRLRDVYDLHLLWLDLDRDATTGYALGRASSHGLGRAVWYSLDASRVLFGTPIHREAATVVTIHAPGKTIACAMRAAYMLVLLPGTQLGSLRRSVAAGALLARAHWLRMPPGRLIAHLTRKLLFRRGIGLKGSVDHATR